MARWNNEEWFTRRYGTFDGHPDSEAPRPWGRTGVQLFEDVRGHVHEMRITAGHPIFDR